MIRRLVSRHAPMWLRRRCGERSLKRWRRRAVFFQPMTDDQVEWFRQRHLEKWGAA